MTWHPDYVVVESRALLTIPGKHVEKPVVAKLGKTTLILLEPDGSPIAHWTLTAVRRINPGSLPAKFAPFGDGKEFVTVDDEFMVQVLDDVQTALRSVPVNPKRSRRWKTLLAAAAALAVVVSAPEILIRQATALAQKSHRAEIGEMLLAEHVKNSGPPCRSRYGASALERLEKRLFGKNENRLRIVPGGSVEIAALPGDIVVARISLLQDRLGPEVFGGYILREQSRAQATDPLYEYFSIAGVIEAFKFLVFREIDADLVRSSTSDYMERTPDPVDIEDLVSSFERAGISVRSFVQAATESGEEAVDLSRIGPAPPARAVLDDAAWLHLQNICADQSIR